MISCHKSIIDQNSAIAKYIRFGESLEYNKRPTCASRNIWYSIGENWSPAPFIFPAKVGERFVVLRNKKGILEDKKLYGITPKYASYTYWGAVLNSTINRFFIDLSCRQLTGAQAIADIDVKVVEDLLLPNVECLNLSALEDAYKKIAKRIIKMQMEEEYTMADRKELDNVIFDALCLTQAERNEVYRAVCELVQQRLAKAGSV